MRSHDDKLVCEISLLMPFDSICGGFRLASLFIEQLFILLSTLSLIRPDLEFV